VEEHDSMTSVISAFEAGTGVGIAVDALGYAFGNRVKLVPHARAETNLRRSGCAQRKTQPCRRKILALR
jgi:hypothetical protein